jgi:hypothetical protein
MAAAVPFIAAGAAATSSIMEGAQARAVASAQAAGMRNEARNVALEAGAAEEAKRRETREAFGELRAAGAQAGLSESVTFEDAYRQAATAAELDALNIAYSGETRRKGLLYEAAVTRAARPSWAQIGLSAGTRALTGYTAGGGKLPSK